MKITIWTAISNNGDSSSSVRLFPSEEKLREELNLDDEDFERDEDGNSYGDYPVEIDTEEIEVDDYNA